MSTLPPRPSSPRHRAPTHPGEILRLDYLTPLRVSEAELATHLDIPAGRIVELVRGERRVDGELAWMLADALGTSPEFWTKLQNVYDLATSRPRNRITRLVGSPGTGH